MAGINSREGRPQTIQISQQIVCCSAVAPVRLKIFPCLFCSSRYSKALSLNEPAVDNLLDVLLIFYVEFVNIFKYSAERDYFSRH